MSRNGGNGNQGNSFWRRNGSSGDQHSAPSGGDDENAQPEHSAAFSRGRPQGPPNLRVAVGGGGWGRSSSSSNHSSPAGGGWGSSSNHSSPAGGGWGSSSNRSSPAGGGWGRSPGSSYSAGGGAARQSPPPNFAIVLIAALLLLPGVTQPIADEFTREYIVKNRIVDPHTDADIERAIAAFKQQHQKKSPAPPEGYTTEHVSHCFREKYDLPENLLTKFEEIVSSYIMKNPKQFTMKLETAVNRALLQIHEIISKENGGSIPEKADQACKEISDVERFRRDLRDLLVSYNLASQDYVDRYLANYIKMKPSELFFPIWDMTTGDWQCLSDSSIYSSRHRTHAAFNFFTKMSLQDLVIQKLRLGPQGQIPFSMLSSEIRSLVISATDGHCGEVLNAFLMIYPPEELRGQFRDLVVKSLITSSQQAELLTHSLTSPRVMPGDISIVMPDKIYTRTKADCAKGPQFVRKQGLSQFQTSGIKGGIFEGIGSEIRCWLDKSNPIPCTYMPANMKLHMTEFCKIVKQWGGIPLNVVNDTKQVLTAFEIQDEETPSSVLSPSSDDGGWGAAAP